ncbi:uncharacterized protein LOC105683926 [Athalia rosae]|uniref:uncharacterized protein LOC105683926 n=1 Tax=Athalia rosae TaxID=37344 RepID=UPI000625BA90|nr:uncharacterized protein LOC105683926 [Athalia rosae]
METVADSNSSKIGETPHVTCHKKRVSSMQCNSVGATISSLPGRMNTRASSSYLSSDSGYISFTPSSASPAVYTPVTNTTGCRLRSSGNCSSASGEKKIDSAAIVKRRHRLRNPEPFYSERASRFRSKLNQKLDATSETPSNSKSKNPNRRSPGYRNNSINNGNNDPGSELDGLLKARLRSADVQKTSVPTTPASRLQLLSSPPSPAIPSLSFVATEPIEDVEMNLVIVSQSTPHILPTSPTTSRQMHGPVGCGSSIESRNKLSKLVITDVSKLDMKPKRLNFTERPKFEGIRRTRALPYCAGKGCVDFLTILGEQSDHWRVVSKILSLLSPQDLCAISMVSKPWRRICARDSRANIRRLRHIMIRQNAKENLKLIAKAKADGEAIAASPKSRYSRKGFLVEVQNLLQAPESPAAIITNSPPVSPSKVKFHSFVKAGRTLEPSEHLLRCPRCLFACQINEEKNTASCSRQGCSMEFCILCSSRHTGPCKMALLATPTKKNAKRLIVGSRQSKRNLRRL